MGYAENIHHPRQQIHSDQGVEGRWTMETLCRGRWWEKTDPSPRVLFGEHPRSHSNQPVQPGYSRRTSEQRLQRFPFRKYQIQHAPAYVGQDDEKWKILQGHPIEGDQEQGG